MAATLKTIAERAGLSQSTVSQILNRKANDFSSEKTRQLVFQLAHELGYKQKFGHKVLRGDKTNTLALLISMHNMTLQEHVQKLLTQLLTSFGNKNYGSYTVVMESSSERNLQIVQELCARGTDQFIFLGVSPGHEQLLAEIAKHKKRTIGFDAAADFEIKPDITAAVFEILKFFLEEKCSNFKMFLNNAHHKNNARFAALQQLFPQYSADELFERYVIPMEYTLRENDLNFYTEVGYKYTAELLEQMPDIQAIFYHSDYFALGGLRCLMERGRIPGKDILVGGFNNIHAVQAHVFPVSTGVQPINEITEMLLDAVENNTVGQFTISSKTIIRKI